jgi:hypothetical protein
VAFFFVVEVVEASAPAFFLVDVVVAVVPDFLVVVPFLAVDVSWVVVAVFVAVSLFLLAQEITNAAATRTVMIERTDFFIRCCLTKPHSVQTPPRSQAINRFLEWVFPLCVIRGPTFSNSPSGNKLRYIWKEIHGRVDYDHGHEIFRPRPNDSEDDRPRC